MSEENLTSSVNKNYLEKVMNLAETTDVLATEDIFDSRGMKLVAKGVKISRSLQERLILRKLSKPLESSIAVEGGVDIKTVVAEAKRLSETVEPIACMLKVASDGGTTPFKILAGAQIGNAMSMMLTITERGGDSALSHSVMVSLMSVCLAKQVGLSEKEQTVAALAGLLHDIGELYIEPQYLNRQRRLLPHEWRHLAVHPRIGQMLITELESYPPAVAQAVSEHHERFDGVGYPRQLAAKDFSAVGQVLAVSEKLSRVLVNSDRPLERAELALKIIPGEHAKGLISAVSKALRLSTQTQPPKPDMAPEEAYKNVCGIFERINLSLGMVHELLDSPTVSSKQGKGLLLKALNHIHTVERSFTSTGLYACMDKGAGLLETQNMEILFEAAVAAREIQWRLCNVARNLALHSVNFDPHEIEALQPLANLLDWEL
jgi:HD-GYP domain-containing protein (c-di-GMP phosphodiesterase class II)